MIFLDIETQNDWTAGDFFTISEMKISYTGVIDDETGSEMDFWENDMKKLDKVLKETDKIVHYNGFTFDMPVLANYLGAEVNDYPQLDLMVALHKKLGFRPKLDDVSEATLGYGKTGSGADAVKYWKAGDLESLKSYCLQDVRITRELYHHGLKYGKVKYYDRSGFLKESEIDWSLGEKVTEKASEDVITMF